jgi:hypothetical protein
LLRPEVSSPDDHGDEYVVVRFVPVVSEIRAWEELELVFVDVVCALEDVVLVVEARSLEDVVLVDDIRA